MIYYSLYEARVFVQLSISCQVEFFQVSLKRLPKSYLTWSPALPIYIRKRESEFLFLYIKIMNANPSSILSTFFGSSCSWSIFSSGVVAVSNFHGKLSVSQPAPAKKYEQFNFPHYSRLRFPLQLQLVKF